MHLMKSWLILVPVLMFILSTGTEVHYRYKVDTDKTSPWHGRLSAAFRNSEWKRALFGVLALPVLLVISSNEPSMKRAAVDVLRQRHSQFFVAGITLALGLLAFWSKKKSQINYGLFEIAFGVASAFRLSRGLLVQEAMLAQWASLVGAVYVVSRGLNNIADGEKQLRKRGVPFRRHKLKIWLSAEVEAIKRRALG